MLKKISFVILFIIITSFSSLLYSNGIQNVTLEWASKNIAYDVDLSGSINIGDKVKFIITLSNFSPATNTATIDIGILFPGIELYNDGSHGDTTNADNVFTVIWTVKEGTSVYNASIKGNFWDTNGLKTKYCASTLSFDAERPIVNNINVSPNAYNPYTENCEIAYSMTETVSDAVVKIYNDFTMTNLVKELPKPPGEAGDNFITWWDGKNDSGNFEQTPPDKDYYINISCSDLSGNYSQPAIATIKISTVKIEIISFDITPSPVTPDGDGVNDNIYVNTKIMMYSWDGITKSGITTAQMLNLGFTAGAGWAGNANYADGDLLNYWPYAKTGFVIYTAQGQKITEYGQDLDPESDYDQYLVNKFTNLSGVQPDGDNLNDWETLTEFFDDGLTGNEFDYSGGGSQFGDGIFTASRNFYIKLEGDWDNGVYIVKGEVELTGIKAESNSGVAHFLPDWKGGYVSTEQPAQATFKVDINTVNPVDSTPPYVISVFPENNSKIIYSLSYISAYIADGPGGSGVDFADSDIYLTDSNGNKIPGVKMNNAIDAISWKLDSPLDNKGTYYIYVLPVDKRGNQLPAAEKYSFSLDVVDDDLNLITVKHGGNVVDETGTVFMTVPPYAVSQDMRITVYKPMFYPGNYQVYSGCEFIPSTLSFKRPVKIILHYNNNDKANLPAGVSESALKIYNWQADKWVYIGGRIDKNNMSIAVEGIREVESYYSILPDTTGGQPGTIISDVQVDKPFKKNGYISFQISGSIISLQLLIYDLNGYFIKKISPEINGFDSAGYYNLTWDLTSGMGDNINNGIYIFRFVAEREDGTKKVVSKAIPVIK